VTSWQSDCAVLYRSVARDADPLVAEMRKRGIPYVVKLRFLYGFNPCMRRLVTAKARR
jgi:superfamily I DNA/RNA helicase